jgi:hypothetical protein
MTYDNLTIGEDEGIKGGICNVVYFRHSLNSINLSLIYNLVKNSNPPVFDNNSKKTM